MIFCHCDRVMNRIDPNERLRRKIKFFLCTYVLAKHSVHCTGYTTCQGHLTSVPSYLVGHLGQPPYLGVYPRYYIFATIQS